MKITEKQILQLIDACKRSSLDQFLSIEYREYCNELITEILNQQSDELQEIK